MAPASPTVARWELSLRLSERRRELGLSAVEVADHLGVTRNYLSLVENDKTILAEEKLDAICKFYDFPESTFTDLARLRDIARRRGWWMDYTDVVEEQFIRYCGLEYGASSLHAYEGQMVNGLLQTEAYAREIMSAEPMVSDVQITRLLKLRQQRQERLTGVDPLRAIIVMSEAVLHQVVGTFDTLVEQLRHLTRLFDAATTTDIRILPFSNPPGGATGSSTFHLLDFDRPALPRIAWMEAGTPIGIRQDATKIEDLSIRHQNAVDASLDRSESRALIKARLREAEGQRRRRRPTSEV